MEHFLNAIIILPPIIGLASLMVASLFTYFICKETKIMRYLWTLLSISIVFFLFYYAAYIYSTIAHGYSTLNFNTSMLHLAAGMIILFATYLSFKTIKALRELYALQLENKALSYVANHDYLTRLKNRPSLMSELTQMIKNMRRGGPPCSLLFIDLDDFKGINDDYGHAAGDYVLTKVADVFNKRVRATDLLARYGGDEFILVLYNTNEEQAKQFSNTLIRKLATTDIHYKNHNLQVTCSIGIAAIEASTDNIDALIERADRAAYAAKESGIGQAFLAEDNTRLKFS